MDNPRNAWIVAGIGIVIGIVALVIGIGAKNNAQSESDVSAQVKEELAQTQAANQGEASQLKKQGQKAVSESNAQDKALRGKADTNAGSISKLQSQVSALSDQVSNISGQLTTTQNEVTQLGKRVTKIENQGG